MYVMVIPIVIGILGTIPNGLVQGLEELEIERTSKDHTNCNIIIIG